MSKIYDFYIIGFVTDKGVWIMQTFFITSANNMFTNPSGLPENEKNKFVNYFHWKYIQSSIPLIKNVSLQTKA